LRVAVVGAGFSGLMFAMALARAGANVDLYEEHERVGFPEHCTGLVSLATVRLIGRPAERSRLAAYEGFIISGPRHAVRLRTSEPVIKLDRVRLEQEMLDEAVREGVRYRPGAKVRVTPEGTVLPEGREYDLVVLAEGYTGRLRRSLGIGYTAQPLYGVNAEVEGSSQGDFVALFDNSTSRGLFSWYVPMGSTSLVGTASSEPRLLQPLLREAMKRFGLEGARVSRFYGGPVITGPPAERLRLGKLIAVGDAAGMNKPLTGGGLYPSAKAAVLALSMISDGVDLLSSAERALLAVSRELRRSYHVSKLLHARPDIVDMLAEAAEASGLARAVSGRVDYDVHYTLFTASIRSLRAPLGAAMLALRSLEGAAKLLGALIRDAMA